MKEIGKNIYMYWGFKTIFFTVVVSFSINGNFLPL